MTPVTSASSIRPVDSTSPGVSLFPQYFPLIGRARASVVPEPVPRSVASRPAHTHSLPQHAPRLASTLWPIIAERAEHESLRDLAVAYGVSHETIRGVVRRVRLAADECAWVADRAGRAEPLGRVGLTGRRCPCPG